MYLLIQIDMDDNEIELGRSDNIDAMRQKRQNIIEAYFHNLPPNVKDLKISKE